MYGKKKPIDASRGAAALGYLHSPLTSDVAEGSDSSSPAYFRWNASDASTPGVTLHHLNVLMSGAALVSLCSHRDDVCELSNEPRPALGCDNLLKGVVVSMSSTVEYARFGWFASSTHALCELAISVCGSVRL